MHKLMSVLLIMSAVVILTACGDSGDVAKTATALPESTPLPLQSILIITVEGTGDITSEAVLLENRGSLLNLTGWQITGPAGQTFTFPELRLFGGSSLHVFSRAGDNTPVAWYWGSSEALWTPGSTLIIQDETDLPQARIVINE